MAEFQELIKNFERIRDYMRQFYIYGFKVRSDYSGKSARTYDNEKRRIESLMAGYTISQYTAKGKKVYINVDSKTIPENPLYAAWKSKSFTDNDLMLHFLLTALLKDYPDGISAGEAAEQMSIRYGAIFDNQTVRLKLREYEALGIAGSKKAGKELHYFLHPLLPMERRAIPYSEPHFPHLWVHLLRASAFYQGAAPFGIIGSTILDRSNLKNQYFQFKHHFIVHTLEDGVLLKILEAIKENRSIQYENKSHRSGLTTTQQGIPLRIFVSTQTGRRYLCLYLPDRRRFQNVRLDSMSEIRHMHLVPEYDRLQEKLTQNLPRCFGVSFGGYTRIEEIHIKLYINEEKEDYILNRLFREGRGGEIMRIRENEYLYSGSFFDTNEMLSWVKSFTGRILDIQGTNEACIQKVTDDWNRMYQMYCEEE